MSNSTLVRRFLEICERGARAGYEDVLAPRLFVDANVPEWRFQLRGPEELLGWFDQQLPEGQRVLSAHRVDTADGFVLEVEAVAPTGGVELYSREVWIATVADGLIESLILYCTGMWSPARVARQRSEAPMVGAGS